MIILEILAKAKQMGIRVVIEYHLSLSDYNETLCARMRTLCARMSHR